jgi:hypothetical protein
VLNTIFVKSDFFFVLEKILFISIIFKEIKLIPNILSLSKTSVENKDQALCSTFFFKARNLLLKRKIFTERLNKITVNSPLFPTKLKVVLIETIKFLLKKELKKLTKFKDFKFCEPDKLNRLELLKKGRIDCKLPF